MIFLCTLLFVVVFFLISFIDSDYLIVLLELSVGFFWKKVFIDFSLNIV